MPAKKNKAAKKPAGTVDKSKKGCAVSFLNEERGELDEQCERDPEELQEEYHQPSKEKEAGGEG